MKTQLEFYMEEIARRIERLYELVVDAFMKSIQAFKELDQGLAVEVRKTTEEIEELAYKIEDNVFETIARRQPVARDLRTLASYNFVALHLHRIGDHAAKIAHLVKQCEGMEHYKEIITIPALAKMSMETLSIAMRALLQKELSEISRLEELEATTDREMVSMFEEITDYLRKRTDIVRMSLIYVIVGRYCERAADHAFSIAERAIYVHTGHRKKLGLAYQERDTSRGLH